MNRPGFPDASSSDDLRRGLQAVEAEGYRLRVEEEERQAESRRQDRERVSAELNFAWAEARARLAALPALYRERLELCAGELLPVLRRLLELESGIRSAEAAAEQVLSPVGRFQGPYVLAQTVETLRREVGLPASHDNVGLSPGDDDAAKLTRTIARGVASRVILPGAVVVGPNSLRL